MADRIATFFAGLIKWFIPAIIQVMRSNPYKLGKSRGVSPRLKQRLGSFTLKGREGRWWRRAIAAVCVVIAAVVLAKVLKPETQLMNSVEIRRIEAKGMLSVAVRDDMPGFCMDGEGLEAELALLLAKKILPESDDPIKLVPCSSRTVTTKLSDGTADVAIALQTSGQGSAFSYSYPYYEDRVLLVTLSPENRSKPATELTIGYIPETFAGKAFESYVKKLTSTEERGILDKLLRRAKPTPEPENAVTVDSVKYGSYDELLFALKRGDIEAAVMAGAYINKYFRVMAEELSMPPYYVCDTEIGVLQYCIIASSDEPALTQLADMLIYEIQENGLLGELINKYLPGRV